MSALFLCHIAMATGWHVWVELSVSRWRSSFIRFAYWEFLQHIQLKNSSSLALPKSFVLEVLLLSALYPVMDFVVGVMLDDISVFYLWFIYVVFLSIQLGCFFSTRYSLWQSCKPISPPFELLEIISLYIIYHTMEDSAWFLLLHVKGA